MALLIFLVLLAILVGLIISIKISVAINENKEKQQEQQLQEHKKQILEKQLKENTWNLPVVTFVEKCKHIDFQPPLNDNAVNNANKVIIEILTQNNIPPEYHKRYLGKEKILFYYQQFEELETTRIVRMLERECKIHNFSGINSEASFQKALVILENAMEKSEISPTRFSIYTNKEKVKSLFDSAIKNVEKKEEQKNQRLIKQMREEEALFAKECLVGLEFTGKEKSIQYCKQMIAHYEQNLKILDDQLNNQVDETAKKSMDYEQVDNNWAIHGGVASAIAGPVVGAVMAADAKQRIDQRNAKNAELSHLNMQLFLLKAQEIKAKQNDEKENLEHWQNELRKIKYAMEEWQDENHLLNVLNPTVEECAITKTGAVKIHLRFASTSGLRIFGEKPACIDGSIKVILKKDSKVCGTAICCLPYLGTTYNWHAKCICTETTDPNAKYEITFEPNKLWAQEIV